VCFLFEVERPALCKRNANGRRLPAFEKMEILFRECGRMRERLRSERSRSGIR
jgi:hypothetical protein